VDNLLRLTLNSLLKPATSVVTFLKITEKAKASLYVSLVASPKMPMWLEQKTYLSVGYTAIMLP